MILAFDTATDQLTVALGTAGEIAARVHEPAPRAHLGRLLPTIDSLLASVELTIAGIDYLAVGIGPGSFTGLRIGVATAQGLAHALKKPLIGVSTLDIIARGLAEAAKEANTALDPDTFIYPVIDAKRREVYTASYDTGGNRQGDYRVLYPEDLAAELADLSRPILMGGDALARYPDIFSEKSHPLMKPAPGPLWLPDALVLIKLAEERIDKTDMIPYWQVLPIYIRLSDAEENLKREKSS